MKRARTYCLIFIVVALCLALCACDKGNNTSTVNNSSLPDEEKPILVAGDFKPTEGAYITYEKALEQYGDTFIASLASSSAKNALTMPKLSSDITQIRVSVPERTLILESENDKAYHIYYGYCIDGEWRDVPADNYNLKTLGDLNSGFEDGWYAIMDDHVVRMGPYVLLAFNSAVLNLTEIKDSLNSEVLVFKPEDLTDVSMYCPIQIIENALAAGTDNYNYHLLDFTSHYYIALEYDKIPTDYTVTVEAILDFKGFAENEHTSYTYTYDDIMEALNRKR